MNMVATANCRTFAPDADLVLDAAGGDAGAFESLFRRHGQGAWRLARAAATTDEDASKATAEAFARVLRDARRGGAAPASPFVTELLAAAYRGAAGGRRSWEDRPGRGRAAAAGAVGAEQAAARAFASLPARWRAALWLLEGARFDPAAAGVVMGVSGAAAVQLGKRGRAGLEQRVTQGGGQLPLPALEPILAAAIAPMPASLAARCFAKWRRGMASGRRRSGPVGGWLAEGTTTPLKACTVGLCALGIVAAAVVSQHGTPARIAPTGQVAGPGATPPAGLGLGTVSQLPNASAATPTTVEAAPTVAPAADTGSGGATVVAVASPTGTFAPPTTAAGVGTSPPTTAVPVATTTPTTTATTVPVTTTTLPVPAAKPVVQVSVNTGPVAVNLGVGPGACNGVGLLGVQVGCSPAKTGLSISLLGTPLLK